MVTLKYWNGPGPINAHGINGHVPVLLLMVTLNLKKMGQGQSVPMEWTEMLQSCFQWPSWIVEMGQDKSLSMGRTHMFKCCYQWSPWIAEMGQGKWMPMGWMDLFLCCWEWPHRIAEMGEGEWLSLGRRHTWEWKREWRLCFDALFGRWRLSSPIVSRRYFRLIVSNRNSQLCVFPVVFSSSIFNMHLSLTPLCLRLETYFSTSV